MFLIFKYFKKLLKFTKAGSLDDVKITLFEIPKWLSAEDQKLLVEGKQKMLNEWGMGGWAALHYAVFYHQNEIGQYLIKMLFIVVIFKDFNYLIV